MIRFLCVFVAFAMACGGVSVRPDGMRVEDCTNPDTQRLLTFCASPKAAALAVQNAESKQRFAGGDESFIPVPVGTSPTLGPADAPVTIVMFTDLQCGFCARGHKEILDVVEANPNDVRLVFKNMPLPFHENAVPAALGAYAAEKQGKFWEFLDIAYANQQELAPGYLPTHARTLGLDIDRFKADFATENQIERVQQDLNLGVLLGVQGTPTFFINGIRLVGMQAAADLQKIVDTQKNLVANLRAAGVDKEDLYWRMVALNYEPLAQEATYDEPPQDEPEAPAAVYVPVDNSPTRGPEDAVVTIVQFSEFECPFCARVLPSLEALMTAYPGKIRIVFKHFPLEFHKNAMPAAKASVAAHEGGKFWEFHDLLFQNQRALTREDLLSYAKKVGLKENIISAALDSPIFETKVQADMELASSLGVRGTPSTFVNGIEVSGAQPFEVWESLVNQQIEASAALEGKGLKGDAVYRAMVEINGATGE